MKAKHLIILILSLTAVGAAILALIFFCGTICPLSGVFGLPCPFCGLTRATSAALRGDFAASLRANPTLLLVLANILAACRCALRTLDGRSPTVTRPMRWFFALSAVVVAVVYVYRMATMFPDVYPMNFHRLSLVGRIFGIE